MSMNKETAVRVLESKGARTLGPSVAQSARELIDKLMRPVDESATPSEGIYYVLRYPDGWQPFALRFDEFPEMDHSDMWADFVAPVLAQGWSRALKLPPTRLENRLKLHAYGFPRGRVARAPGKMIFNILYGGDVTPAMGVSNATIERLFSVTGVSKWVRDEHEQCQLDDRDAVRDALRIGPKESWKAV